MRELEAMIAEAMPRNPRYRGGWRREVAWKVRGVARVFSIARILSLIRGWGR